MEEVVHRIAHDLNDSNVKRSKDVVSEEDVIFDDLKLSCRTLQGLRRCGFSRPSPVQLQAVPLGRCGLDLVVQSKAGTGKTCIFTIIALEALKFNPNNCTQSLIIAPTREIASQIHEVISSVGSAYEQLRCALCIGGVGVKQDRATLNSRRHAGSSCQIVVGTPGRIKQLIELNILRTQQIELFVLDEADKLIDEQFKDQIDEIYKRLSADRQMIVTSATYPNELSEFLKRYMKAPIMIKVGKEISLEAVEEYYITSRAGNSLKQSIDNKLSTLKQILMEEDFHKCFIFTNYQARAPQICDNLNEDRTFLEAFGTIDYICAELSQEARTAVFLKFKQSDEKALVSTDISARGIDIQGIDLVINFDLPVDNATYYHRIGRAGRFGKPGKAISIVSSDCTDQSIFRRIVKSDRINKLDLTTSG